MAAALLVVVAGLLFAVYGPTRNPLQQLLFGSGINDQMEVSATGPLMDACPAAAHTSQFGPGAWDVLRRYGQATAGFAQLVPALSPEDPPMTAGDFQALRASAGTIQWAPGRDIKAPFALPGVIQLVALRCDTDQGFVAVRLDGHRRVDTPFFFDLEWPMYRVYRVDFPPSAAQRIRDLVTDNFEVARGF
jgi:hypothetical protein